MLLQTARSCCL